MQSGDATAKKTNILRVIVFVAALVTLHRSVQAQVVSVIPPVPMMRDDAAQDVAPSTDADRDELEETPSRIPLILNDSVENQLAFFTSGGRAIFQEWLDRSGRYLPEMKKIFREYNLPEDLAYLPMIESGFDPFAVSRKKAVGLWQFMEATAREYGLVSDRWVDERRDPIKATRAAAAYLRDLHNLFGSWPLALASYNAGTGTVQSAVLRVRSEDFWDLRDSQHFRRETRNYVPRFMAALIIAKDPIVYGFTAPGDAPFEYDELVVRSSTGLDAIARLSRCSLDRILELNPELIGDATPQGRYQMRLPRGARPVYEANLARALRLEKTQEARRSAARDDLLLTKLTAIAPDEVLSQKKKEHVVPRFGLQASVVDDPASSGRLRQQRAELDWESGGRGESLKPNGSDYQDVGQMLMLPR